MKNAIMTSMIITMSAICFSGCGCSSQMNSRDAAIEALQNHITTDWGKEQYKAAGSETYTLCRILKIGEIRHEADGMILLEFTVLFETRRFSDDEIVETREADQDHACFCVYYDKYEDKWDVKILHWLGRFAD